MRIEIPEGVNRLGKIAQAEHELLMVIEHGMKDHKLFQAHSNLEIP